jgi:hypothetical protein
MFYYLYFKYYSTLFYINKYFEERLPMDIDLVGIYMWDWIFWFDVNILNMDPEFIFWYNNIVFYFYCYLINLYY